MFDIDQSAQILNRLQLLEEFHGKAAATAREIASLVRSYEAPKSSWTNAEGRRLEREYPIADRETLSVQWRSRTCRLGNTFAFWLFERLARRPGQSVSHQQLLDDVWHCVRSKAAIRSVVKVLRQRLREAGMDDLATAIDGSGRDHYCLRLPS